MVQFQLPENNQAWLLIVKYFKVVKKLTLFYNQNKNPDTIPT